MCSPTACMQMLTGSVISELCEYCQPVYIKSGIDPSIWMGSLRFIQKVWDILNTTFYLPYIQLMINKINNNNAAKSSLFLK